MDKKNMLIFEDRKDEREKMDVLFKKEFNRIKICFSFFNSVKDVNQANKLKPFDIRLREELNSSRYGNIELIVCDSDLSDTESYRGLSEVIVSKVASDLFIPICLYALGESYKDSLDKLRRWTDLKIILNASNGYEKLASECRIIFQGFQELESKYTKIIPKIKKKYTPSEILALILDKPDLADKIALYGAGNKQMLTEIMPYYQDKSKDKYASKRMVRLLGYWLWNSILEFPGIVLNDVAAASYLNINETEFKNRLKIREIFNKAVYKGPFAEIEQFWWRDDLDAILFKENCKNGLGLVHKKGFNGINECQCSIDKKKQAGYYCMITRKPVSLDNSRSNINWFPSGADLARISTEKFEELAPWLGIY